MLGARFHSIGCAFGDQAPTPGVGRQGRTASRAPLAGRAGDAPAFTDVMARLRVPRWRGRPRTRPYVVPADKADSSRAIRDHLRKRGIRAVMTPVPSDQRGHRLRRGIRAAGHRPSTARLAVPKAPS